MYEYIPGGDLTDVIRVSPTTANEFRVQQTLAGLRQLCTAVSHFHRLSPAIVHRDLKPSNILVDRTSRKLLVTDFGIGLLAAKSLLQEESRGKTTAAGRQTESLRGAYTPLYSSPQQQAGAEPDPRDDVHALGVIAYQWLTGQLTHGAGTDFVHELREIGTPDPLIDLIGHCVAKNPARRPANAGELLARVQAISTSSSPPTAAATVPAPRSFSSAAPVPVPAAPVYVPPPFRSPESVGSNTAFVVEEARLEWYRAQAQSVPLKPHPFVLDHHAPAEEPELDPLPEDLPTSSTVQAILLMVAGGGLLLTVLGLYKQFFLFAGPLVAVGFGLAALVVSANSPYRRELTRRQRAYDVARRSLVQGEQRWDEIQSSYEQQHASLGQQIAHGIANCRQLAVHYANDLASLSAVAADSARKQHMKANTLALAEIPNIGDKLKQVLAANGIVSASDIDARVIATISGFGKDRTQSLLAWRDEVLRAFRFDPSSSIPGPQLQQLADGYRQKQGAIFQAIEDHLRKLLGLEAGVEKAFNALVPELRELVREWMRARGNLRLIETE
jgi:hypothetical protein